MKFIKVDKNDTVATLGSRKLPKPRRLYGIFVCNHGVKVHYTRIRHSPRKKLIVEIFDGSCCGHCGKIFMEVRTTESFQ